MSYILLLVLWKQVITIIYKYVEITAYMLSEDTIAVNV